MDRTYVLYQKRIAGLFRDLLGQNSLDGVGVDALASAYLAGLDGLAMRERILPGAKPDAGAVAHALRQVLIVRLLVNDNGYGRSGSQ